MDHTWGNMLRWLRVEAGLSLDAMATRVYASKARIGHTETGRRHPTPDLAADCDQVLGTTPLLALLYDLEGGGMRRRALIKTTGAVAGVAGIDGVRALAEVIRASLDDASGGRDWDTTVADYARRLVIDPSPSYGAQLLATLMLASQQLAEQPHDADTARAAAHLALLHGLWQGNGAQLAAARGWYRSAAMLADRSHDATTAQYVRARAASRAIYEGYTARETVAEATHALHLTSTATAGALEARSALAHVHGLTGRTVDARREVAGMRDLAEALPDADQPGGPAGRAMSFHNWVECRGSRRDADRAHAEAEPALREIPVWHAEARVYYGRALASSGDVADGIAYALAAVRSLPAEVRTVGMAVLDLLTVVPAGYRSAELDELRRFAAPGPGPWETLA